MLLIAKDLYCFDKKSNKIIKTNTVIKDEEIHVYSACEDRHGNIWLGTNTSGIIKLDYDKKTNSYERAELGKINAAPTKRTYVLIDYKNRIWIGTDSKGFFQYNEKEHRLINFVKNETNLNSISDNTIFSLYIDRSGVLWIGTFTMGLCKYDLFRKEFYHYKSIKGNPNSLGGNVISSIHGIRPGELWIGSDNGGGVSRFIFDNINEAKIIQYKFDQINANNNVLSLVQRKNGNVWIGITGEAISIIKPEKSGTNELPIMKTFVHKGWPFSIFEDRDETIWVGAWGTGLTRYYNPDNYINFINDPENPNSLCDNIIWAISEDQSGNMWIGGRGKGLSILPAKEKNKSNPEFINYKHDERYPRSLSNNLINVFCQDHEGNMWIGTGGGLNKVIKAGNSFSDLTANDKLEFISYHIEDGLPSETILGIVEDNNGDLWISTLNGLAKFITSKDSFIYYGISDGLQSREFGHNAYFKD